MYILTYKAMTLYRMGKNDESSMLFEKVLNSGSLSKRNEIFAMIQYAGLLTRIKNIDSAIYYYEKAILESEDLELIARGKLSNLYAENNDYEKAINILNIDGFNNMFLNTKRARIYSKMTRYKDVLKELEKEEYNDYNVEEKENLDDKYVKQDLYYIKGHAYYKLDKFDEALSYLAKACIIKTRDIYFRANIDIIRIYTLRLQLDDAINLCEEIKKSCTSNYFYKIIEELEEKAYIKKNDYKKAEEQFKNNRELDERTMKNLGKIELLKGNFEKAEQYFSSLDIQNGNARDFYDEYYRLALIKFRLKKYDETLIILNRLEENLDVYEVSDMAYEIKRIKLYIYKKLNKDYSKINDYTYSEKQIISYDINDAIDHVMNNHYYNPRISKFNDNINIEELFNTIKDKMNDENVTYDSLFDKYMVKYPNIGINMDNESIHQILVLTLPNTKDIITMYPCDGTESVFNLEELEEKAKPKVKRLSQVDKFKQKYGNI